MARSAFLAQDFSPTEFLSSLQNRHQTLEDLRQELRTRSQELNKELLDLVNDNYQDFLGLGDSLKGGEEKVEEVRLGLLGFRREVGGLKKKATDRREELATLIEQRQEIAKKDRLGRNLLEVDSKLSELEESLKLQANGDQQTPETLNLDFSQSEDDSEEEDSDQTIPLSRLTRRAQRFLQVRRLIDKIGSSHPFLTRQEPRLSKIRQTLLLDLNNALSHSRGAAGEQQEKVLKIVVLYRELGEVGEALKVLKKTNSR